MSGRLVLYGDEKDPWIALDYYQVFEEGRGRIDIWHNYTTYTRYIIPFAVLTATKQLCEICSVNVGLS